MEQMEGEDDAAGKECFNEGSGEREEGNRKEKIMGMLEKFGNSLES